MRRSEPAGRDASPAPPVLIAGLARSGTTWLAKLLDSHPDTLYRHEPDSMPTFPHMPAIAGPEATPIYGGHLAEFVAGLPALNRVGPAGSLPVFRKRGEGAIRFQGRRLAVSLTRVASRRLGNIRIPGAPPVPQPGAFRLLWKSVVAVGRLGCLMDAVQPLQVVLLVRHPCGVIESRARGVAGGNMAPVAAEEFAELTRHRSSVAADILQRTPLQQTLELEAFRWAVLNSAAIEAVSRQSGCTILRYEDLCADPESVLRELLPRLDLDWDDQVGRFLTQSSGRSSGRFYGLHRRPSDIDGWRNSLSASATDRILEIIEGTPAGRLYAGPPVRRPPHSED